MRREQIQRYQKPKALRDILHRVLAGKRFKLMCGHHVTFGEILGNDVIIRNNKELKIICTQCGY